MRQTTRLHQELSFISALSGLNENDKVAKFLSGYPVRWLAGCLRQAPANIEMGNANLLRTSSLQSDVKSIQSLESIVNNQ